MTPSCTVIAPLRLRDPILVLDGDQVSALAIVRSLGRRGLRVEVGASREHPIAGYSRYSSRTFIHPDPLVDIHAFRRAIDERLRQHRYSLIIPVTDLTISPLVAIRASVEATCPIAMASDSALTVTSSKSLTCELAQKCDVPIPKTRVVSRGDDLNGLDVDSPYPVVVKPDRSKVWSPDGRGRHLAVTYAWNREELHRQVERLLQHTPAVIQAHVRGEGVGLGVLARRGEILFAFQYRRLHEVPISGGGSSYRMSEPLDPRLLAHARTLFGQLRWDGVAMIEFKRDPATGALSLIEINGRFWGSLPLAIAAGADFPALAVETLFDQPPLTPRRYKPNVRCRLLSRDIDWLAEALLRRGHSGMMTEFPSYRQVVADSLRVLNPMEGVDTFDRTDVRPWLVDLGRLLGTTLRRVENLVWSYRAMRRMKRTRARAHVLAARILSARSLLVVCSGNVVRSPFCAHLLRRLLPNRTSARIVSAGVWASPGTLAHPTATRVAREFGIDLGSHVSSVVSADAFASADLVLAMEFSHVSALRARFRRADKVVLVGCLSSDVPLEIDDPIDGGETAFRSCFAHISRALAPLARGGDSRA